MKKRFDIVKILTLSFGRLMTVALALMMTGCVFDDALCPEDQKGYDPADVVWLSIDMVNQQTAASSRTDTRAVDAANHESEAATAAENYILHSDIKLVLLNADRVAFKCIEPSEFTLTKLDDLNKTYRITAKINKAYFKFVNPGKDMYILAVANTKGTGQGSFSSDVWMKDIYQISAERNNFTFNPGDNYWIPDGASKRIPMSGIKKITAPSEEQLEGSTTDNPFDLTTENPLILQRSMVKLRVLDAIPMQEADLGYKMHIESVSLYTGKEKGTIMPLILEGADWADGTCMLEYASWGNSPRDWYSSSLTLPMQKQDSKFPEDGVEYDCFIGYAAEQFTYTGQDPKLRIVTHREDTNEFITTDISLEKVLAPVNNNKFLSRNHVYQFTVRHSLKSVVAVDLTVCPWNSAQIPDITFN